jgi:hypothetical protein
MSDRTNKESVIKLLMEIPGVGKSIANDLWHIGIRSIGDLKDRDPQELYDLSNRFAGVVQDRCLLYTFRCAVYYASTQKNRQKPEKLKWWNWKDNKAVTNVKTSRQRRRVS